MTRTALVGVGTTKNASAWKGALKQQQATTTAAMMVVDGFVRQDDAVYLLAGGGDGDDGVGFLSRETKHSLFLPLLKRLFLRLGRGALLVFVAGGRPSDAFYS